MASIAHANGYRSWKGIYDHPRNAGLRKRCPNPAVLLPGEKVFLPPKGTDPTVVAVDQRHVFRVQSLKAWLRFTVGDHTRVFAAARYVVKVDGVDHTGTTDDAGLIALRVPPDARAARVRVWPADGEPIEWHVRIGHLDPADSPSGKRSRLANLGYAVGAGDEQLARAVAAFQHDHDLEATGELDPRTTERLLVLHGE